MSEHLLPCPFCGSAAEIVDIDEGENEGGSCVCCTSCLASGDVEFGFKENFVSNWNRRAALTPAPQDQQAEAVELSVWYGKMPESNGRQNWTASLHRKGRDPHMNGFCFSRSEYPDRVRYEADRMRWIIGELTKQPFILDYDERLHSGYVEPAPQAEAAPSRDEALREAARTLLTHDANGARSEVYAACEGRAKVYKFDAVLQALAREPAALEDRT